MPSRSRSTLLAVVGALTLVATALLACSSTNDAASASDGGSSGACPAPKPSCYDACTKRRGDAFCTTQGTWECTHTDPAGYFDCANVFHQTNCDVPLTPDAVCDAGADADAASEPPDGGAARDAAADGG